MPRVWSSSGGSCGQYLTPSMEDWIEAMEAESKLVWSQDRYSLQVKAELLAMSAATIDQYQAPAHVKDLIRDKSATKPGQLLRNSITVRKASDEIEAEPGFFEVDTLAHCGPLVIGEVEGRASTAMMCCRP